MKNDLLKIGPLTVHGYGLMIAIGVLAAYGAAAYRGRKRGMDTEPLIDIAIWGVLSGLIGAKLLYCITQYREIFSNPRLILDLSDGYVVYGGIITGILAGYLYCKKKGLDFIRYFDLVIPSIPLAQGFGRLGCFLAGCCYGLETNSRFGVIFPPASFAPSGIKLVPIQLISSGLDFILFLVLVLFARKQKASGQVGSLYLILYGIGRFIIEFYRGDLIRGNIGTISTSQFISLFFVAAGIIIFGIRTKSAKQR